MEENDLITRRDVEIALLEKGQKTKRYKLGETWELTFSEIREALSKYQSEIVRCKDCKHGAYVVKYGMLPFVTCGGVDHELDWFCADGKRRNDDA